MKRNPTKNIFWSLFLFLTCFVAPPLFGVSTSPERFDNFIAQGRNEEVKIQMSLKHRFLTILPFYYAYTFKGFWLTGARSAPFKDINHQPEIFYDHARGEVGYEHLSNGLDNHIGEKSAPDRSRSLQRVYIKPRLVFHHRWFFKPKISIPVFYRTTSEVHDYIGHFDFEIGYHGKKLNFSTAARRGRLGGRVRASLSFNPLFFLPPREAAVNRTQLFFEGFHGHAETLLEYRRKTSNARIGMRFLL